MEMNAANVGAGALVALVVLGLLGSIMLVPVLLELRRMTYRFEEFIRTMGLELRPVVREAQALLHTADKLAQAVEENGPKVGHAVIALEQAGEHIRTTAGVVRAIFGSRLIHLAGLTAGVRAGVRLLWRSFTPRREAA